MTNLPLVSVVMPVRNEGAFMRRSLGAVLAQDYPQELMEVIVADGQSTDNTREIIAELALEHPNLVLIDNAHQIVATGLNEAIALAKGEIVIRVDGHCEIAPDYVRRCVETLRAEDYAGVGGPVETVGETTTAKAIAAAMSSRFGVGGSAFRVGVSAARLADTVPFPAYSRRTLQLAGRFDEELVRNQDDEYNYRIRKLGGRLLLSPDIRSRYYSRATLEKLWKQYWQYGYWKVRVLQKHPRQMQPRQFMPAIIVATTILLSLTAPILVVSRILGISFLSLYLAVDVAASVLAAHKSSWRLLPLIFVAFAFMHFAYGGGFLFGLIRFWKRWELSAGAKVGKPSRDAATLS